MKIVSNWTSSWRWVSMQATAAVTTLNLTWVATPTDLKSAWANKSVEIATVLLGAIGMFGRLIQQKSTMPAEYQVKSKPKRKPKKGKR